ncbi:MAG: protein-disulfide reductase DsbD family protein [Enhygromyxa sp.]
MSRPFILAIALLSACTGRERDPAATEPKPVVESQPKAPEAPLVTVELGLVGDELREALAARLGPDSPLVGAEALLAVHHRIAAPWHIYWKNPGDSGLRTRLSLELVGGESGPALYPGPNRFVAAGGQVSYGWERDAVLFVPLSQLGEDARVELRSDWLACHESCIPGHSKVEAVIASLERREDEITRAMIDRVPAPTGERLRASWSDRRLRVEPSDGGRVIEFFPYAHDQASLAASEQSDAVLELDYRLTGSPPAEQGQGVLTLELGGETHWLELAVPWPAT